MLRAIIVYAASAALTMTLVVKLAQRGGRPYFAAPATIFDHTRWPDDPVQKLPALLPVVAEVIPPHATVTCFMPVGGKVHDDYCSMVASGYLLRQRLVPLGEAEWVVAVRSPFDDPHYELIAVYPEGRLYKRRP